MRIVLITLLATAAASAEERLGFGDAVRRAVTRNPTMRVAQEETLRAQAIVEEVRASWMPTLTANGSYTRLDNDRVLGTTLLAGANQLNGNLLLSVPLVQTRAWVQSWHAHDNLKVAQASGLETMRQLAISTARTYLSIIAARRVVEVSERALVAATAHYDFAHQRFAAGYGSRLDQTRAAQEVATDRSQLERARAALVRLKESLGVLLGADSAVDAADEAPLLGEAPLDEASAEHEASVLRSDVQLERMRQIAAHNLAHDQWSEYLPTLLGTFSPFLQDPATTTVPSYGWQAQILLQWSIYDGGLRYGLSKERRALEREAAAQVEAVLRQAGSEVRTADEDLRRSTTALEAAREAAKEAAEAQDLTATGYRAGASTNIEVIDAERTARDAATAVAQAEDAERQAMLDLLIASGRFPAR